MLLNDFFHILTSRKEEQTITVTLKLNPDHSIFNGHFPGQPVVPGVCMMQMVKEILETELQQKLVLKSADHLKFLSVISPAVHGQLQAELKSENTAEGIRVQAQLSSEETLFFKMKSIFQTAA